MCLETQHTRIDHLDGIPNPIVVAIDIKRKKINFTGAAALGKQVIDILDRDPALREHRRIQEAILL